MKLYKKIFSQKLNFSWLSSRKLILTLLIYDCLSIIASLFITNIIYNFYFINFKESFILILLYTSLSYIFGRYKLQYNYSINANRKNFLKDLIYLLILVIFYFFIINLLYSNQQNNLLYMRKLPFFSLSIILCTFSSIKIKRNFRKFYKNQKKLVFSGSEEEFMKLKKMLNYKELSYKFNLERIIPGQSLETDCSGILLSKNNFRDDDVNFFISEGIKKKIDIYFLDEWLENNLDRIPNEYINFEKFLKKYNLIKKNTFQARIKRFGDVFLSIFLLSFTFPLLLFAGILIWFTDKGPIIYKQLRVGENGKEFYIYKLRTMIVDAEKNGPKWVSIEDKRVTLIGKLLRKTRIDEIPQLICVLNGDMSLIGPRPERPEIEVNLKCSIKNYELRHLVKPGLSGWAQVNANYAASLDGVMLKHSYDLYYIANQSIFIDLLILIKTMKVVFTGQGSEPKRTIFN